MEPRLKSDDVIRQVHIF